MIEQNGLEQPALFIKDTESAIRVSDTQFGVSDGKTTCNFTLHIKLGNVAEFSTPRMALSMVNLVGHERFDISPLPEDFGFSRAMVDAIVRRLQHAYFRQQFLQSFTVRLVQVGTNKINVIKAVRETTFLGLKEAKDLVDAAPSDVRIEANKEKADAIVKKFADAGALAEAIPLPVSLR
jgi:large subunit ribosomal protein L7/L12